jgi:hypothetical protein
MSNKWPHRGEREAYAKARGRLNKLLKKLLFDCEGLRGSSVVLGGLELAGMVSLPGHFLELPAYLFAAGQTGKTIEDIKSDKKYFKQMPLPFKLPTYAKRAFQIACPYGAAASLSYGIAPEYAGVIPSAVYIGSELVMGRLEKMAERIYFNKHPELKIGMLEAEIEDIKASYDL